MKSLTFVLLVFSLSVLASAQQPIPADAALTRALIGTWITPPSSSDYMGIAARHHFHADGTSVFHVYQDDDCSKDSFRMNFKWSVQNGALILTPQQGPATHEEIVSIDDKKMVLRSANRGSSYHRLKSDACPTLLKEN